MLVFQCCPEYYRCGKGHEPKASRRGPMTLDDFYYAVEFSLLSACVLCVGDMAKMFQLGICNF